MFLTPEVANLTLTMAYPTEPIIDPDSFGVQWAVQGNFGPPLPLACARGAVCVFFFGGGLVGRNHTSGCL